jgi:MerR family transcriptional regulator, light-induced transcriptional regulator
MASVYGFVRTIAKVGSMTPSLRSMVSWNRTPPRLPDDDQRNGFVSLVEREIIPRLVVAHDRDADLGAAVKPTDCIAAEDIADFAPLALDHSAAVLLDRVEIFLDRGLSVDDVYIHLLAPAARHLGTMWEEDTADFVEVTMALWRLQEVVRELSARVPTHGGPGVPFRALFSVMPGEQHSFGTVMIEDMFRRAGWQTDLVTECDTSKLLGLVAGHDYDLVCLTATSECKTAAVSSIINGVRSVARNPHVSIMVGGRAFSDDLDRAKRAGADGGAATATEALALATELVEERMVRRNISA